MKDVVTTPTTESKMDLQLLGDNKENQEIEQGQEQVTESVSAKVESDREKIDSEENNKNLRLIPAYRYNEVKEKYKQLESEVLPLKQQVEESQKFFQENPEKAELVRKILAGEEIGMLDTENNLPPGDGTDLNVIEQLQKKVNELEQAQINFVDAQNVEKIQTQLGKDLREIQQQITTQKMPFTTKDILETMEKAKINDMNVVFNLLKGQYLSQIQEGWEKDYTERLKKIPQGSPSLGGLKGELAQIRPKTLDESSQIILNSGIKLVK